MKAYSGTKTGEIIPTAKREGRLRGTVRPTSLQSTVRDRELLQSDWESIFTRVRGETVRKGSEELGVYPYRAPQWHFSTHFGLLTPPKSTLRVLLAPLFGQSLQVVGK